MSLNNIDLELFKHHDLSKLIDEIECGICFSDLPNKTEEWALHFFSNIDSCMVNPEDCIRNRQFHVFHKDCGLRWVKEHQTCATCRAPINEYSFEKIIEKDKESFFSAVRNGNKETIEFYFWEFSIETLEEAIREAIKEHHEGIVKFLINSERAQEFSANCLVISLSFLLPNHKETVASLLPSLPAEILKTMLIEADKNNYKDVKKILLERGIILNRQHNDLSPSFERLEEIMPSLREEIPPNHRDNRLLSSFFSNLGIGS